MVESSCCGNKMETTRPMFKGIEFMNRRASNRSPARYTNGNRPPGALSRPITELRSSSATISPLPLLELKVFPVPSEHAVKPSRKGRNTLSRISSNQVADVGSYSPPKPPGLKLSVEVGPSLFLKLAGIPHSRGIFVLANQAVQISSTPIAAVDGLPMNLFPVPPLPYTS